jgi:3-hydroxyisobutyrate dehydrogenase-like beta-hydroxyacid dehydrogenase
MEIGMIGLGKMGMGMGMAQRLQRDGHCVVGFARSAGTRAQGQGIEPPPPSRRWSMCCSRRVRSG